MVGPPLTRPANSGKLDKRGKFWFFDEQNRAGARILYLCAPLNRATRNEGATMRRLITSITDTIATTLGKRSGGNEVTNLVADRLPALGFARCLLTWLTGIAPVGRQVDHLRHMQPAVVLSGAARAPRHYRLGALRPRRRRMEPRSGASLDRS